jgi:ABC-2 type transport system permease protein
MRPFLAIVRREFLSYFFSPLAYVVLTGFLLMNGILFNGLLQALNTPETPRSVFMSLFFTNVFFWIFMMLTSMIISMRLIAEERKSGSIEALLTAPVSEATVVTGKFMGGWFFLLFLWLPTAFYPLLLSRFGAVDIGPVASGYVGMALVGALFVSAGTFASALTKNQIVAAIIGFVFIIGTFFVGVFQSFVNDPDLREKLSYLNLLEHMDDFSRGIVDTRRLVYMISTVVFFLFLSTRALEANKGK